MTGSNIILIIIVAVVFLVLIWCIKNGNNIKLGKKKEKKASKPSKEDKFKDVIPKEKKKPVKKDNKPLIKKSAKKEIEKSNATVTKITKEDFKNNDIKVPEAMLEEAEKEKLKEEIKKETKANKPSFGVPDFKNQPLPEFKFDDDFKFDKFNDNFKFDDDFKFDDEFMFDNPFNKSNNFAPLDNPFAKKNDFSSFGKKEDFKMPDYIVVGDEFEDPMIMEKPKHYTKEETLENKTFEDRVNMVFSGITEDKQKLTSEVIIGQVLSEPKARTNRRNRERKTM